MALIECPECNKQVSSEAGACPSCGHPIKPTYPQPTPTPPKTTVVVKKKRSPLTWGCLTVALLLIMGYFASVCFVTSNAPDSPTTKTRTKTGPDDLTAGVIFTGTQFQITNSDSFAWRNVRLTVNSKYKYELGSIAAGATVEIGVLNFTKGDGERFNPLTHKPKDFFIAADTKHGRLYYTGGWK